MNSKKDLLIIKLEKDRNLWKNRAVRINNILLNLDNSKKKYIYINTKWRNIASNLKATIIWVNVYDTYYNYDLMFEDGQYIYHITKERLMEEFIRIYF